MTSQVFEAQRNKTVLPEVGWKELQVNLFRETFFFTTINLLIKTIDEQDRRQPVRG